MLGSAALGCVSGRVSGQPCTPRKAPRPPDSRLWGSCVCLCYFILFYFFCSRTLRPSGPGSLLSSPGLTVAGWSFSPEGELGGAGETAEETGRQQIYPVETS